MIKSTNFWWKLLDYLFQDYNRMERPSLNDSESLKVELGLSMQQIVDVDEKKQIIISSGWLDMVYVFYQVDNW